MRQGDYQTSGVAVRLCTTNDVPPRGESYSFLNSIKSSPFVVKRIMSTPPYQLAFSLHGHASDVRALCCPGSNVPLLLSASRDGSAIVWGPSAKGKEWDVKMRVEGPEKRYISCVGMVRFRGEGLCRYLALQIGDD